MCYFALYLYYYIEYPGFTTSSDVGYTPYSTDGPIYSLDTLQ